MSPTVALQRLVDVVAAALDAHPAHGLPGSEDQRRVCEAAVPALKAVLRDPEAVPAAAREPLEGAAIGNLLHADPTGRFHVLAVVFPEGTSSGVHHHGCWGVIGYLEGGDEETRYQASSDTGDQAELTEASRHVWHQGDVTFLLPPDEGWHRVRNPGPGPGVSIHVLCRAPADHPHRYWDRRSGAVLPFPFVEVAPGRWRAEVIGLRDSS
jgi:predicted metal-dependent enzyme (double-stranded beta helix superfamily)